MPPPSLKAQFDEHGFVIVANLVSPDDLALLRDACDDVVARTRRGEWTLRRTVGKQFPPYGDGDPDSWGVQMLMHPDLGHPVFAKWYTSDALTDTVRELLQCRDEDLQMELFNLLINPTSHDFALRWHRDDVKGDATLEEEEKALTLWHHGRARRALYDDSCLFVVPGTHKLIDDYGCSESPLDMPGAMAVSLKPGETVFYNSNILHLGTYSAKHKRATLHASMGDARGGSVRARNVLQHGLNWMKEEPFRNTLTEKGKTMLDRLIKMQKNAGEVGYSLEN
ncbi:hypothetical protein BDZ89DRAFT_1095670 [Hymenopellis radicata]|nr:hypothetical protein BDZ89DRAFT_1095670 [Hymenopellis radicata]